MDWRAELETWFAAHAQEGVELLAELVRQNTVNPPGNERCAAAVVESYLARYGVCCTLHEKAPGRTNLLARIGTGGPTVFVPAHTDVVPVGEGWQTDPFEPVVRDGFLYGRGSTDNKGPLTALLLLASFLKQHEKAFKGTLLVGAVADEERGSTFGLTYLLDAGLVQADHAIVPDTGVSIYKVSCGEKGLLHLDVILQGVQAHASQPEKGLNAVYAADAFIREVRALHGETIGYCATGAPPPFSPTTLNVTKISAGSAYNIVPGQCTLGVDIRFVPGETVAQWTDRLGAIALRLRDQGLCTGYEVVVQDAQDPFVISEDNRVIQAIDASVAALTGQRCARITMNGTTVCKQLVQHNIPAVGWSMDGADQAHMANEHLALSEIPLFGTALGLVFLRLCEAW